MLDSAEMRGDGVPPDGETHHVTKNRDLAGGRLPSTDCDSGDPCPACKAGRLWRYASNKRGAVYAVYLACFTCPARFRRNVQATTIHPRRPRKAA